MCNLPFSLQVDAFLKDKHTSLNYLRHQLLGYLNQSFGPSVISAMQILSKEGLFHFLKYDLEWTLRKVGEESLFCQILWSLMS